MLNKHITDSDFENVEPYYFDKPTREAARGVLCTEDNRIVIMYMGLNGGYKLPGGGIENEETPEEAFRREVLEETGYHCREIEYIGEIFEHKKQTNFCQKSYCYIAKVDWTQKEQKVTLSEGEKRLQLEMRLVTPEEVIRQIEYTLAECRDYKMKFLLKRDLHILNYVGSLYR